MIRKKKYCCQGCGGPHPYDTSVPSVLWNRVIRGNKLPDFLCPGCILVQFAIRGVSFTATLWGESRIRTRGNTQRTRRLQGLPIEVRIGGRAARSRELVEAENNRLRVALGKTYDTSWQALRMATRPGQDPARARRRRRRR